MVKHFGFGVSGALVGLLLGLASLENTALAQTGGQGTPPGSADRASNPADPNAAAATSANAQPSTEPGSSGIEHSLFSSLFMAGKTQDEFKPLTPKERVKVYTDDLFSPFHIMMAGAAAGIAQAQNVPPAWGQGAEGYGRRFANYYAYALTAAALQMAGEDILHEDNLYFGSGEHGFWRRTKYAIKSSVLARGADGTQHLSASQIGSTAGAAFISRLWQPRTNDSAGDGAVSFGISMATNAGVNVIREFLPDVTRHIFHRSANRSAISGSGDGTQ